MINYNNNTSSDMWNVTCQKRVQTCSKPNVTIASNAKFASNLSANICLLLKNAGFFSRWLWTSFLWNLFCLKIFVSLFCSSGLLYFFIRVTSRQGNRPKIMWDSSCSGSTRKINLRQLFLQCWRLSDSNFNGTEPHQRVLLETFRRTILQKSAF